MSIVLPPGLPARLLDRLSVDEHGCWIWSGAKTGGGQPLTQYGRKQRVLTREFFAATHGLVYSRIKVYSCPLSRLCLNPAHLRRQRSAAERAAAKRRERQNGWIPGLPKRIADKIEIVPGCGCWIWMGAMNAVTGYGVVGWKVPGRGHRGVGVHRIVHVLLRCPELLEHGQYLPRHLHVHHLPWCSTKLCCNPEHTAIKDSARHARDHRMAETAEGRGWHTPEARAKSKAGTRAFWARKRAEREAARAARPTTQPAATAAA